MSSPAEIEELGRRVRKLRIERRMTLKQLETSAGLSATHLSDIERGRTSPTIGALIRIARSLGKPPSFFIESDELAEVAYAPREESHSWAASPGITAESLTRGIPGGELFTYRLKFKATPAAEWRLQSQIMGGDAVYYVTSGMFRASVGEKASALSMGDALQIPPAVPHRIKPISAGASEMIALFTRSIENPRYVIEMSRASPRPHDPTVANGSRDASPSDPMVPQPLELGHHIKMLRVSRGLTLKDLEERGGISATHVSEIERGKASPTVGALGRIAQALGVRSATLIEPRSLPDVTVMRAAERSHQCIQWNGVTLHPVTESIHGAPLGAMILSLPIGRGPGLTHRHEGEEWITVLSGLAEIRIDSEIHVLREGDSLHFRAERPHSYSNPASAPAVLLAACRPRLAL